MSVDVDKQTVEVQFFGDHKRMTIAPKDCHIYTQVCPSANIASLRESFSQAVDVSADGTVPFFFQTTIFFTSKFYALNELQVFITN